MQHLLCSIGKQLSGSLSITEVLSDYFGHAQREARQFFCSHGRFDAFWKGISPEKKRSFDMTIYSHTDAIEGTVRYFQQRIAGHFQQSEALVENIGLCLRESLANAIIHGNLGIPPKLRDDSWEQFEAVLQERQNQSVLAQRRVVVRCEIKPQFVKLVVEDQGTGFNAEKISARLQQNVFEHDDTHFDALSASGRGLVLITTFMDHVFWNPRGNCITMVKQMPASE